MQNRLAEKVKRFPRKPGVYLFKDADGKVLYVGKAKRLRDRVHSYFVEGRDDRPQIRFLLKRTSDIDFIVTDTEKESLLLENSLIKEHRPRYNIQLRDDKSYVSIRIGAEHPSPGIWLTRRVRKDGAYYFGPYDSGTAAREAVDAITRHFRLRSCTDTEFANRVRPCLKHDVGRCTAPCVGRVSKEDYAAQVAEAEMFLRGQSAELIRILSRRMMEASESMRFEEAARLRDVVAMMRGLVEKQNVVRHGGGDHDVIGVSIIERQAAVCLLTVRGGTLLGKRIFRMADAAGEAPKIIEEFLLARYGGQGELPPLIVVSIAPDAMREIESILGERRGGRVELRKPVRGEMRELSELADKNAREAIVARGRSPVLSETLENLGARLGAGRPLDVVECVDISNLSGREAVGSVVVFVNGEPDKSRYRIYNIRTLDTPDDYAMMYETLSRRYGAEGEGGRAAARQDRALPDLLLVDGGKGQLAVARRVMEEMGLRIPLASIAKAHPPRQRDGASQSAGSQGGRGEKKGHADQIFIPDRMNPLGFKRGSRELLFLMRVRDEAHRFGITAHRRRRAKAALSQ